MGVLDMFDASIDCLEKSGHTFSFEKDEDRTATCLLCSETLPEEIK